MQPDLLSSPPNWSQGNEHQATDRMDDGPTSAPGRESSSASLDRRQIQDHVDTRTDSEYAAAWLAWQLHWESRLSELRTVGRDVCV
jgi:hypothetical protein